MKELFVQHIRDSFHPSSEEDLEISREYKQNQILRCKLYGVEKPRSVKQMNTYWATCQLVSENTENRLWNTKEKTDFQCRVELHFVDPDLVVVKPDGTVIFSYRSIAFINLGHAMACNYFDGAFVVMAKFLGTTTDKLIEMVKDRIGVHVDFC